MPQNHLQLTKLFWPLALRACILLLCFSIGYSSLQAQVLRQPMRVQLQPDTVELMRMEDFFRQLMQFHPVARQAALMPDIARQELRIARSLLDPSLNSKFNRKEFQEVDYYNYWDNVLHVPTWFGVDLRAGYERNVGAYMNRDRIVPTEGLTYVGVSVPIGQGWVIDERRAAIRQAQNLGQLAEAERISLMNKLLLQAAKDYWDWAYFYNKWLLHREGFDQAIFRLDAVKIRARLGDMAAIDTVEAMIELQNRAVMLQQSEVEYRNSRLIVSNYLWRNNEVPVELSPRVVPDMSGAQPQTLPPDSLQLLLTNAIANHPDLIMLEVKARQLDIDRRLIANKFLPKLSVDYNLLQTGPGLSSDRFSSYHFSNNYKMGVSFSYPLFLRNERGKLQLTRIKLEQVALDRQQGVRDISTGVQAAYNEWLALETQIREQERLVQNAQTLRNGEQARFENGESTLFLVNVREMSLINHQVKLQELRTKYAKSRVTLQWSAGAVGP